MANREKPTAEYLRSILDYDPASGILKWRKRADVGPAWNGKWAGKVAGCVEKRTSGRIYVRIRIFERHFYGHVIIWCMMTGEWPTQTVDHANGIGINNWWDNLREASNLEQMQNLKVPSHNTTGVVGVYRRKNGRYTAQVRFDNRVRPQGTFDTLDEAATVRAAAKYRLHTFNPIQRY